MANIELNSRVRGNDLQAVAIEEFGRRDRLKLMDLPVPEMPSIMRCSFEFAPRG